MISIIIPIYNEATNLEILSKKIALSLKDYNFEVVFINDGSIDKSLNILNVA